MNPISIRLATDLDMGALVRLAQRDSTTVPAGRLLVAAVGGELRAAVSIDTRDVIADPFHPSAHIVELLRLRARQFPRQGMKMPWVRKRVLSPVVDAVPSAPPS